MYKLKICKGCGVQFQPTSSTQNYCNKAVQAYCPVCGKPFTTKCCKKPAKCCSNECAIKYARQQITKSYANTTKTCVLCGKEFTPKNNTQSVCSDQHYRTCVICGKKFPLKWYSGKALSDLPKTCSPECKTKASFANGNPATRPESKEKARQTLLTRYGVDHPMHSEDIKAKVDATQQERYGARRFTQTKAYTDKAKATNQERYGADWAMQTPGVQQKSEATLKAHYGVTNPMQSKELKAKVIETYKKGTGYEYPMQNPEVKTKLKDTMQKRYGVENAMQAPEVKAKAVQSNIERWGGLGRGSPVLAEKIKNTNVEKYGCENPASSPEVQAKISDTMMKKYGAARHNATWEYRESVMTDPTKAEEWQAFLKNPEEYIAAQFNHKPTYRELADVLGVNDTSVSFHVCRMGKRELIAHAVSYLENEVVDILNEIKPGIQILRNDRQIIKPYELDIVLPEYNLAIEINPTGTHNSSFSSYGDNPPKAPSYHKMKSNLCEKRGIFLFHIFGYEWTHKKDIIISMLRNLLGCNATKIYARNCELKEVSAIEAVQFLYKNHRQSAAQAKVRYGLYYQGQLVSLMTFGRMRNTLGRGNEDLSDCWELIRYCNLINTSVVGGASKLFKHFIRQYNPSRIRSFSDRAHTKGNLYSMLGFTEIRRSSANYVWVDTRNNKAYNRVRTQKRNLKKFLHDHTLDLNLSERQIMESHGFAQVFDSGTITWQWINK